MNLIKMAATDDLMRTALTLKRGVQQMGSERVSKVTFKSGCLCFCSNLGDESKQQNSELSEQLKLRTQENGAMRLELEDYRKRLEIAELMLQQVR